MKYWLVVALVACKGSKAPPPKVDDAKPAVDMTACNAALKQAANAQLNARPQILINGCPVCGDWKPVLAWNAEGTAPNVLEKTLEGCEAFCNGDAKMKFMAGALKAKGSSNDTVWRRLADACGTRVIAATDHRFMSAPFFALDRIARVATEGHGLELPLPALTVAGTGSVLPDVDQVSPRVGSVHVSLIGEQIFVGKLPRAKLAAGGLEVENDYPGQQVAIAELAGTVEKLVVGDPTSTVSLLAPHAMPAENLVPVIAAIGSLAPLYLGATAHESPEGWQLPGAIPVGLGRDGEGEVVVTGEMTVQNLASELAKKAAQHVKRVGVTKR